MHLRLRIGLKWLSCLYRARRNAWRLRLRLRIGLLLLRGLRWRYCTCRLWLGPMLMSCRGGTRGL